ncbi:hypothetical protein [Cupriavidus basilensis]
MTDRLEQAMQREAALRATFERERCEPGKNRPCRASGVAQPVPSDDPWRAVLLHGLAAISATVSDVTERLSMVFPALPAEVVSPTLAKPTATLNCFVPTWVELECFAAFLQALPLALTTGMAPALCLVSPWSMSADRFVVPGMQALLTNALYPQPPLSQASPLLWVSLLAENTVESLLLRLTRALHIAPPAGGAKGDRLMECHERIVQALGEQHLRAIAITGIARRHLSSQFIHVIHFLECLRQRGITIVLVTTPAIDWLPAHGLAELNGMRIFRNVGYTDAELEGVGTAQWRAIYPTEPRPAGLTQATAAVFGQRDWIQFVHLAVCDGTAQPDRSARDWQSLVDTATAAYGPQMSLWKRLFLEEGISSSDLYAWADWIPAN